MITSTRKIRLQYPGTDDVSEIPQHFSVHIPLSEVEAIPPPSACFTQSMCDRAGVKDGLWLITLYVKVPYRRRGIGARLLDRCVDEARRAGYPALHLWTESSELTCYYACRGWRRIGQDEGGDDVMVNELGLSTLRPPGTGPTRLIGGGGL